MLDVLSFIEARGGNPEVIRESQRKRYAPVEAVDEVIALYEEGRLGLCPVWYPVSFFLSFFLFEIYRFSFVARFNVDTKGREINRTQKEIGAKKKVLSS